MKWIIFIVLLVIAVQLYRIHLEDKDRSKRNDED